MSVGDVNSEARGSGARFNDGKPAFDLVPLVALEDCARVFDYGRAKYASWNWAKGMNWSIPFACAMRHLAAWQRGEDLDPESGLPHLGHVMANLVMLSTYARTYPEGDDRTQWLAPRVASPEAPAAAAETDKAGQGASDDADIQWTRQMVADEICRMIREEVKPGECVDLVARYAGEGQCFRDLLKLGVLDAARRGAVMLYSTGVTESGEMYACWVQRPLDSKPDAAA